MQLVKSRKKTDVKLLQILSQIPAINLEMSEAGELVRICYGPVTLLDTSISNRTLDSPPPHLQVKAASPQTLNQPYTDYSITQKPKEKIEAATPLPTKETHHLLHLLRELNEEDLKDICLNLFIKDSIYEELVNTKGKRALSRRISEYCFSRKCLDQLKRYLEKEHPFLFN